MTCSGAASESVTYGCDSSAWGSRQLTVYLGLCLKNDHGALYQDSAGVIFKISIFVTMFPKRSDGEEENETDDDANASVTQTPKIKIKQLCSFYN